MRGLAIVICALAIVGGCVTATSNDTTRGYTICDDGNSACPNSANVIVCDDLNQTC